jgi:proteasome activator subunit 4
MSNKLNPQERHQYALGMSALVLAAPYDVPAWLPGVLVALTAYSQDPACKKTVLETFSEFKRTHLESWEEVKQAIQPGDFELISDYFYAPSYFA